MNNIISTKVSIFRNVKDFKFVPKLEQNQKEEIVSRLENALSGKMSLVNTNNLAPNVQSQLLEKRLISQNSKNIFMAKDENLVVDLFNGEHITINSSCAGFSKSTYNNAKEIADYLFDKISFSYSDEYGYLMSNLAYVGAGIKLEAELCLPALLEINKIEQVKQNIRKLGYDLQNTKYAGVYIVSTMCNLGFGENEIVDEFEKTLQKIQDLEIESAKMLDVSNHDVLLDRCRRSLAILKSAYLMNYDELTRLITNVLLGFNLNMLDIKEKTVQKLIAQLKQYSSDIISQSELIEIAKNVQNVLKGGENV